jgi:hypothetical protein
MTTIQSLIIATVVTMFMASTASFAQAQQPASDVALKPSIKLADVKQMTLFLGGVDIRGNEVDAYLDVKATQAGEKAGKKDDDSIVVEMSISTAQNFLLLMSRATLKGADAEKFKEIVSSGQEAAKKAQK